MYNTFKERVIGNDYYGIKYAYETCRQYGYVE